MLTRYVRLTLPKNVTKPSSYRPNNFVRTFRPIKLASRFSSSAAATAKFHAWIQQIQELPEPSNYPKYVDCLKNQLELISKSKDIITPKLKILLLGERNVGRKSLLKILFGSACIQSWLNHDSHLHVSTRENQGCLVFRPYEFKLDELTLSSAHPWRSQLNDTVWTIPPSLDLLFSSVFTSDSDSSNFLPSPSRSSILSISRDAETSFKEIIAQQDLVLLMTDASRELKGGWEHIFLQLLPQQYHEKMLILVNSSPPPPLVAFSTVPCIPISTRLALLAEYLPECHVEESKQTGIQGLVQNILSAPHRATSDQLIHILELYKADLQKSIDFTDIMHQWWTSLMQKVDSNIHAELVRFQSYSFRSSVPFEEGKVVMAIQSILHHATLLCEKEKESAQNYPLELKGLFARLQETLESAKSHSDIETPWMTAVAPDDGKSVEDIFWHGLGLQLFAWTSFIAGIFMELYSVSTSLPYMLPVSVGLTFWSWLRTRFERRKTHRLWQQKAVDARKYNMNQHRGRLSKFVWEPLLAANSVLEFNLNEGKQRHLESLKTVHNLISDIQTFQKPMK